MEKPSYGIILLYFILIPTWGLNLQYTITIYRNGHKQSMEGERCPHRRPKPNQKLLHEEVSFDALCMDDQNRSYDQCSKENMFCHQDFYVRGNVGLKEFSLSILGTYKCTKEGVHHFLTWDELNVEFICNNSQDTRLRINAFVTPLKKSTFHIIVLKKEHISIIVNGLAPVTILTMRNLHFGRMMRIGYFSKNEKDDVQTFSGSIIKMDLFLWILSNTEQDDELQYSRQLLEGRPHPWCLCPNGKLPSVEDDVLCEDGSNRLTGTMSADTSYTPPESVHDGIKNSSLKYGFWKSTPGDKLIIALDRLSKVYSIAIYAIEFIPSLELSIGCSMSKPFYQNSGEDQSYEARWQSVPGELFSLLRWDSITPVVVNELVIHHLSQGQDSHFYEIEILGRPIDYQSTMCNCMSPVSDACGKCGWCKCQNPLAGRNCVPFLKHIIPAYGPAVGENTITMTGGLLTSRDKAFCNKTHILIGDDSKLCQFIERFDSYILCKIRGLPENSSHLIGVKQDITVIIMLEGIAYTVPADLQYEYRPNPVLYSVQPKYTFSKGEKEITIKGKHLNSIDFSINHGILLLEVQLKQRISMVCKNATYSEVVCTMPPVPDDIELVTILLFGDDVNHRITMGICQTPQILKVTIPVSRTEPLILEGTHLNACGGPSGYHVTIDGITWPVQYLEERKIVCQHPFKSRMKPTHGKYRIKITLLNYTMEPGEVVYDGQTEPLATYHNPTTLLSVGISVGCLLIIIGVVSIKLCLKVIQKRREEQDVVSPPTLDEIILCERAAPTVFDMLDGDLCQVLSEKLIDKSRLDIREVIGRGNFGKVYRGVLDNDTTVAMKTFADNASNDEICEFLEEATIMRDFQHPNILSLLGVMVDGLKCYVIMPFMSNGDLRSFVSKQEFNLKKFTGLALDVARGMAYLSKHKFIHRDLAARNCLVSAEENAVIGDFGLARDIYHKDYYKAADNNAMPYKWMALETLVELAFSIKSDVWAFGVVTWEIFTNGGKPYPLIANPRMKSHLKRGHRLEKPDNCPIELFSLLEDCWLANPAKRPSFPTLVTDLERLLVNITTVGCSQHSSSSSSVTSGSSCSSSSTGTAAQAQNIYLQPTKPMPPVPLPRLSKTPKV